MSNKVDFVGLSPTSSFDRSVAVTGDNLYGIVARRRATSEPVFHEVCAALRDVAKNPEWAFVREGPTWHGHRVAGWDELFA